MMTDTLQQAWLKCKIADGMYPGEKLITVWTHKCPVSFFIEGAALVRKDDRIKVTVLTQDSNSALILLPKSAIEETDTIKVPLENLSMEVE